MIDIENRSVTMCIIDDIPSIVEGIAGSIDWKSHGIEIVGTSLNGEDGLSLIERTRPDIIVTDIRMPKMDGLELAQFVQRLLPNSRILFITGYPDFHYAQQALRLGAADFITKPFSLEQIEQAVLAQKKAVQETRLRQLKLAMLEQQASDNSRIRNEHALNLLIRHAMEPQEAAQMWASLNLPIGDFPFVLALMQIDHLSGDPADISMKEVGLSELVLSNIAEETVALATRGCVCKQSFGPHEMFTEPEKLKAYCNHIAFVMISTFHDKLSEEEFVSIPSYLRERLPDENQSFHELKAHLVELCELGCGLLDYRSRSGIRQSIEEALRYMNEHMQDDLTIGQVAAHVHLSPSYFSAMFKRIAGQTFHASLEEMRMKQAERLLLAGFPIQQVAEQVGYKERRYFTSVFKKHSGVTPSEFKQKHWEEFQ